MKNRSFLTLVSSVSCRQRRSSQQGTEKKRGPLQQWEAKEEEEGEVGRQVRTTEHALHCILEHDLDSFNERLSRHFRRAGFFQEGGRR